ncbi:hypothetical protein EST38_g240 [Candolleomyces aberdarensis]|uniref:mannan endo-1,4-beta-mannosidase n=1 Tax=Candolleomyces aberdarensis TaxID=2316362 RepID=A0A4Q2DYJ7_9AGAR|nr:hypothetical protein EST38_g240 [Candolleomyces aberdarensis]
MKLATGVITLAVILPSALAAVPLYGQCGGLNYSGDQDATCTKVNDWYSQCLPGAASSATATPTVSTPTAPTSATTPTATSTIAPTAPNGFVYTSGQKFMLDGKPYTVVGSNSYWVGLTGLSDADMNKAFADIAGAGGTTVRTWGFNEVTSPNGNYYQSWSGSTPTVNSGASGLQNFDRVIRAAKANGIRLIVALTNNWSDYGGMDVYVRQILGANQPHDLFYTNTNVKNAYKNYIRTFIGRYVNETGILAWELANEPRCRGSSGSATSSCNTVTITNWAKEISAYIKSLDSNHLVALGDEGFYNMPGNPSYPHQGTEGIDFDVNLDISTLDFGTVHSYPNHWGQDGNELTWGTQWILDHAKSQARANKPVILEEFGVTSNQPAVYTQWLSNVVSSGLAGDLIWQAGSRLSVGATHNDGFAVYPDGQVYPVVRSHAAALKSRNGS